MGADAFHVYYGLRFEIDAADETAVSDLERRADLRQVAARKHGLDQWWGITPDQDRYFLVVGKVIAQLGYEHADCATIDLESIQSIAAVVHPQLAAAGLTGFPALHFQFEPDL